MDKERAWLPVACLQRERVDTILGGAGAIVARLVKKICHASEVQHVVTGHQSLQYKISSKVAFLGDQDAHRMLWANKGSAGLKPCMFCSNVLKKGQVVDGDAWHTIASAERRKFHIVADEEWRETIIHLGSLANKSEKEKWERAYGLSYDPAGLLGDAEAVRLLPPSASCNDVLHGYFCNGVVSAEIALAMDVAASCGLHLKTLTELAQSYSWRRSTERNVARRIAFLFSEKMFGETLYKGTGAETQEAFFLYSYYFEVLACPGMDEVRRSFRSLATCCRELRALNAQKTPLTQESQVAALRAAQLAHQNTFVEVFGADSVRPKHHHRLHIPDAALLLGFLPSTAPQEKNTNC